MLVCVFPILLSSNPFAKHGERVALRREDPVPLPGAR